MPWSARHLSSIALGLIAVMLLAFVAGHTAPAAAQSSGETVYALTTTGNLISFNSATPGTILSTQAISGIPSGETLRGLDFRPATGQFYSLSTTSRLYTIAPATGAATPIGTTALTTTVAGDFAAFDFNPVPDRIRIESGTQNLRANPTTGSVIVDNALAFAGGDPNAAATPAVVAAGYTNNISGTATTSLYVIDANLDILALQNPPNNGTLNTVGSLGVNVGTQASFDISVRGNAYATYTNNGTGPSLFGTVNLSTGAITTVGQIGSGLNVVGMAVPTLATPPSDVLWALTSSGTLIKFKSDAPGTILAQQAVTGLATGEALAGIDFRPVNGQLYAISTSSRLHTINPGTGAATLVGTGPLTTTVSGPLGFDFNPVPDRIRIVSGTQNLRANPNNAGVVVDGTLAFAAGDPNVGATPAVVSAGYTNSVAGATTTSLYVIDANLDILALQNPPNNGTLNTIGALGLNLDTNTAFDISPAGTAYIAYTPAAGGASVLGIVDLTTGKIVPVGRIGSGTQVRGLAMQSLFRVFFPLIDK